MVNALQLKHLRKRLDEERGKKIREIETKFPVRDYDVKKWVAEGKGKMRSEDEIRALYRTNNTSYSGEVSLTKLFDFSKELKSHEPVAVVNTNKRRAAMDKMEKKYNSILDQAYLGDETILVAMLREFREMTF